MINTDIYKYWLYQACDLDAELGLQSQEGRQAAMWPRGRVYSPNTAQTSAAAAGRGCRGGLAFVRVVACFKPGREAFEGGTLGKGDHSARNSGVI